MIAVDAGKGQAQMEMRMRGRDFYEPRGFVFEITRLGKAGSLNSGAPGRRFNKVPI